MDDQDLRVACDWLAARDRALGDCLDRYGYPPMWQRSGGFASVVLMILEQQVSLESARSVYRRLVRHFGSISAKAIEAAGTDALYECGVTRQKSGYIHHLACQVVTGQFRFSQLARLPDHEVRQKLVSLKGIGPWTADVYLLFALNRHDVWPPGDIALIKSVSEVYHLEMVPSSADCERIAEAWRPWRAVAARMFWYAYLCRRNRI